MSLKKSTTRNGKRKKTKASNTGFRPTDLNKQQTEKLIDDLLQLDRLPNGKVLSVRNITDYVLSLPNRYFYNIHGTTQLKEYGRAGIHNTVSRVMQRGRYVADKGIDLSVAAIKISDDFEFDDGEDEGVAPYEIPGGNYRMGIINDVHIPYHDLDALKIAIHHLRDAQVNKILINGDLFDFHGLSRFQKNPTKIFIQKEIEQGRSFFQQLRKLFPSEQIIYKYGNHDSRLSQYIYEKAPALYGLDALNLSELLNLRDLNVQTVMPEQIIQAGKLNIIHGHEFPAGAGVVNVARTIRLRAGDNIAMGHFHRTQSDVATTISDRVHGSYSIGCLCNLRPKWYPMAYTVWNHGFAVVDILADGAYQFSNYKIVGGRVV